MVEVAGEVVAWFVHVAIGSVNETKTLARFDMYFQDRHLSIIRCKPL